MGMDHWMYLGPYVELPVELKTVQVDTCSRKKCPNNLEAPFCPECGLESAKRFHEFQDTNPPFSEFLFRELNESLATAGDPERILGNKVVFRLVPNQNRGQPRNFFLEETDHLHIDIGSLDIKGEILWFKKTFAEDLIKLQGTYGPAIFRWGFMQWFH